MSYIERAISKTIKSPLRKFSQFFTGLQQSAIKEPKQFIACLSSFVFSGLFISMTLLMLNQDLALIAENYGILWVKVHILFRIIITAPFVVLFIRAWKRLTEDKDFLWFYTFGMLYVFEGLFFNQNYYLAYIEIICAVAWFSTLPVGTLAVLIPCSAVIYSLIFYFSAPFSYVFPVSAQDHLVGIWLASAGALAGGAFRYYWQYLNERLVSNHIEQNKRMIDLGEHLGMIFHDINNCISIINGHLTFLRTSNSQDTQFRFSIDRLTQTTNHIVRLQEFVLGMARHDTRDIRSISGEELEVFIKDIVLDMCIKARPFVSFHIDTTHSYRCSPSGVCYAVINAINNSYQCALDYGLLTGEQEDRFRIEVVIGKTDEGQILVAVRDNGPGFPQKVLDNPFQELIAVKSSENFGIGLRNIKRYISYQGGTVKALNDNGAVIQMLIPN